MGWNEGYTIFEATVIGAYDLGKLDKPLLSVLMEPYRDTDIDSGGRGDLQTRDGKGIEQVVIETWGLEYPVRPAIDMDADGQYTTESDEWGEQVSKLFDSITAQFGWE